MKILRIIYDWPDENVITEGLAPAPYELSFSQAKLGHKITVLCGNLNGKNIKAGRFRYTLEGGKITVYNLPRALAGVGPFFTTSPFILLYYWFLKIFSRVDLVHNHGHAGLCFLIYKFLFGAIDRTPVVGHFHIVAKSREKVIGEQGGTVPLFTKLIEFNLHKLSDFLSAKVSNQIVGVSQDVIADVLQHYDVSEGKVSVLETGVNTSRFTKNGDTVNFGFDPEDKILLNIGRLSQRKNIEIIVKSLKFLPDNYRLVLIGTWDSDSYKNKVQEVIFEKNLKGRVKILKSVPYFNIDRYYRAADIFILPSSYEGLPKVVVEALACGSKVIASGFKMQETIDDIYFLNNIDEEEIASLVKKIINSPSNYDATRVIIEEKYSWDSKAVQLEEIYGKI